MTSLSIGSTLQNGKYEIVKVLGQGGFGITYLAKHTMLDIKVAIKEFFPKSYCLRQNDFTVTCLDRNLEFVAKLQSKFVKEARHIAGLHHDHIIKILDIFKENSTAYYVMDYIDGSSLQELVKENGPLQLYDAHRYISQIGGALDYLHTLKIGHYDVKPGNILLNAIGSQAILIDFGLSKQFKEIEGEGTSSIIGYSNGYAPIEQYDQNNNLKFNSATDTYSLTATLYFLVSGQRPQNATDIVSHGLSISDSIPVKVKDVLRKGLQVQINKRYSSCAELSKAFEAAIKTNRSVEFAGKIWRAFTSKSPDYRKDNNDDDISVIAISQSHENDESLLNNDCNKNSEHRKEQDDNFYKLRQKSIKEMFPEYDFKKLREELNKYKFFLLILVIFPISWPTLIILWISGFFSRIKKLDSFCPKIVYIQNTRWWTRCNYFVVNENGKWGLIDGNLTILIQPQYDSMKWLKMNKLIEAKNGSETMLIEIKNRLI